MPVNVPRMTQSDKKKLYALAGLGLFLVVIFVWNVLPTMRKTPSQPPVAAKPKDGRVRNAALSKNNGTGGAGANAPVEEYGPIAELPPILPVSTGSAVAGRNIFIYPPPPPVKPPPKEVIITPPPPTINLGSITPQQAFAGTPKAVTVTLLGSLFPRDVHVEIDGRVVPSQRISDSVVKMTLSPADLAAPRSIGIELHSNSQPKPLWSAAKQFAVVPSPDPGETFVFTGRVGNQAVLAFKDERRPKLVKVGDVINGNVPWRILTVTDKQVEMLDMRNEIRKSLPIAAKYAK